MCNIGVFVFVNITYVSLLLSYVYNPEFVLLAFKNLLSKYIFGIIVFALIYTGGLGINRLLGSLKCFQLIYLSGILAISIGLSI